MKNFNKFLLLSAAVLSGKIVGMDMAENIKPATVTIPVDDLNEAINQHENDKATIKKQSETITILKDQKDSLIEQNIKLQEELAKKEEATPVVLVNEPKKNEKSLMSKAGATLQGAAVKTKNGVKAVVVSPKTAYDKAVTKYEFMRKFDEYLANHRWARYSLSGVGIVGGAYVVYKAYEAYQERNQPELEIIVEHSKRPVYSRI